MSLTRSNLLSSRYHIGEEPDERSVFSSSTGLHNNKRLIGLSRTVATCKKHKVPVDSLAQQVKTQDCGDTYPASFSLLDLILFSGSQRV